MSGVRVLGWAALAILGFGSGCSPGIAGSADGPTDEGAGAPDADAQVEDGGDLTGKLAVIFPSAVPACTTFSDKNPPDAVADYRRQATLVYKMGTLVLDPGLDRFSTPAWFEQVRVGPDQQTATAAAEGVFLHQASAREHTFQYTQPFLTADQREFTLDCLLVFPLEGGTPKKPMVVANYAALVDFSTFRCLYYFGEERFDSRAFQPCDSPDPILRLVGTLGGGDALTLDMHIFDGFGMAGCRRLSLEHAEVKLGTQAVEIVGPLNLAHSSVLHFFNAQLLLILPAPIGGVKYLLLKLDALPPIDPSLARLAELDVQFNVLHERPFASLHSGGTKGH